MIKVSVIVPVYNVEKYLKKCLTSIVNQTLKEIEIIVVNDGSPDNSQKIIDEFVKKYPQKVKSYIKENGGLSSARNYGLKYVKGEYIAFVDSDDWIEKNMYKTMYKKAKEKNFDLVVCNATEVYETYIKNISSNIKEDLFDKNSIRKTMLNMYPVVWNKIYKKELFNNKTKFKEKVWYEDVEFSYRLIPFIKNIGIVNESYYNYLKREGAITSTFDNRLYNYIDNWNGILKFYKENKLYNEYKKELEYCYVRYLYATFIKRVTNFNKKDYNDAVNTAIKNVKEKFPHYYCNSYFYTNMKGIYCLIFSKFIASIMYKFLNR